jgi:hypothetical protein
VVAAITLHAKHRLEAQRQQRAIDKAIGEAVDAKALPGVRHDDRKRARGLPCLVQGGLGGAIYGTQPGTDAHLDTLG